MWSSFMCISRSDSCCPLDNMPRRTIVRRKSDMRRPKRDKRSVLSDVSFEGSAIIRAEGGDTPIAAGHTKYGTDEMDFDPVCVDDCRTVVCCAQDHGREGTGYAHQLGDRGCARICLLVCMGGVHTACDWSGQTVPIDGVEICASYSDPHNHVLSDGSPGSGHRILSEPCTSAISFSHI